jgi:hypothetical protein
VLELFGEAVTLDGTIINVTNALNLASLYDPTNSTGWLHYMQDASENSFTAYINQTHADLLRDDVDRVLYITAGTSYDPTNNGSPHLDASGVYQPSGISDPWLQYNSLQDFLLSYFADKIFGHPGALAAISNDSALRTSFTDKYNAGMLAVRGNNDVAIADVAALTSLNSGVVAPTNTGEANGLTPDDLNIIVQQMMDAAPDRFVNGDRGVLNAVPWREGDQIQIQLFCRDNTYQLMQPSTVSSQGVLNTVTASTAANGAAAGGRVSLTNDKFILNFTVGPAY